MYLNRNQNWLVLIESLVATLGATLGEIGIKQLKNTASRVIDDVEAGERVIVTKRGRPAAVIMSMEDAEDFVLAHAEEFVEMRLTSRKAHRGGRSTPLEEL